LPTNERPGARREILVARTNIALTLLGRHALGDRNEAFRRLRLAPEDARRMRLPGIEQIEAIPEQVG
jgi:hypothetical protein